MYILMTGITDNECFALHRNHAFHPFGLSLAPIPTLFQVSQLAHVVNFTFHFHPA